MTKFLMPVFAAAFLLSSQGAFAGGPVVVDDAVEVVAENSGSSMGILPIIIIGVALCAALCGGDDDNKK